MAAHILVVDDEDDVLTYFTAVLQENGYETAVARNGAEALAAVRAHRPDVVTLDITMPEQSGVRVYREMKTDPELARIPILIITGIASDFKGFISTRRQVPPPDGYLEKPVPPERLVAEVKRLLTGDERPVLMPVRSA